MQAGPSSGTTPARSPPASPSSGAILTKDRTRRKSDNALSLATSSIKQSIKSTIRKARSSSRSRSRPAHEPLHDDTMIREGEGLTHPAPGEGSGDITVPLLLQRGTPLLKISAKKIKTVLFTLDADSGVLGWESKKRDGGRILIENIKELRPTSSARSYRLQHNLASNLESRWLTIIYSLPTSSSTSASSTSNWKTLHVIALTQDIFDLWYSTLKGMWELRRQLMDGLGRTDEREMLWARGVWRTSDVRGAELGGDQEGGDAKLDLGEVESMCRRLGVRLGTRDLERLFKNADTNNTGYLDWPAFREFVRMLKVRPELGKLHKRLCLEYGSSSAMDSGSNNSGTKAENFEYCVFEKFMREVQKSELPDQELTVIFDRFLPKSEGETKERLWTIESLTSFLLSNVNSVNQEDALGRASASNPSSPIIEPPTPLDPSAPMLTTMAPTPPESTTGKSEDETPNKAPVTPSSPPTEPPSLSPISHNLSLSSNAAHSSNARANLVPTQDMTRPLSEYYISCSHNTYLIGRQLVGVSTIEGYIRALLGGCRSVELDIYDAPSSTASSPTSSSVDAPQSLSHEPVITHGKTLTSSVPLRSVCDAINRYAFLATPYPVIISAEVHCNMEGQDAIARIMGEVFGDRLIRVDLDKKVVVGFEGRDVVASPKDGGSGDSGFDIKVESLPSPEELRGKVLLKAKNLYVSSKEGIKQRSVTVDTESSVTTTTTETESEALKELKSDIRAEFVKARSIVQKVRLNRGTSHSNEVTSSEETKVKMSLPLVALLVYTVGVKCRGFNKKEFYAPSHVFSLSEKTANKVMKQSLYDIIKHNRTHLVRIYPNGMRIGSTNYDPTNFWGAGCQMVALNWQTFDLGNMLNHAMFQRNAKAGYVLKPAALRVNDKTLLGRKSRHRLRICIISGQQLPNSSTSSSVIDPYVEVSLHLPDWSLLTLDSMPPSSPPSSSSSSSVASSIQIQRTSTVHNNGFNPVWEETLLLPFEVVGDMKELVFVRVAVEDEGSVTGGGTGGMGGSCGVWCASLAGLSEGYRHLPLHDAQLSQYLFSTLFVKIELEDMS